MFPGVVPFFFPSSRAAVRKPYLTAADLTEPTLQAARLLTQQEPGRGTRVAGEVAYKGGDKFVMVVFWGGGFFFFFVLF
jgi:hypothetical protein